MYARDLKWRFVVTNARLKRGCARVKLEVPTPRNEVNTKGKHLRLTHEEVLDI